MLVVSRRVDEYINLYLVVGGKKTLVAKVMVCSLNPAMGYARIGIEAPDEVEILRSEIDPRERGVDIVTKE
jgi:sRNA-binding carbon storage regulator CsrA